MERPCLSRKETSRERGVYTSFSCVFDCAGRWRRRGWTTSSARSARKYATKNSASRGRPSDSVVDMQTENTNIVKLASAQIWSCDISKIESKRWRQVAQLEHGADVSSARQRGIPLRILVGVLQAWVRRVSRRACFCVATMRVVGTVKSPIRQLETPEIPSQKRNVHRGLCFCRVFLKYFFTLEQKSRIFLRF